MKTIIMIVPYFGRLPNYFSIWLESCRRNESIDFLLITDQNLDDYNVPKNIMIRVMPFDDIKALFDYQLGFSTEISRPYKLCDYKPAYGELFSEYIKGYDFWGHCDIDLVLGDIRKFVTDDMLKKYDRIYPQGYFSLYANNKKVNSYYRTLDAGASLNWKEVFGSKKNWCFDEWAGHLGGGITKIMIDNNVPVYTKIDESDIDANNGSFKGPNIGDDAYFEYDKGRLYCISNASKKETLLMHFQKRSIVIDANLDYEHYYFIDPFFITNDINVLGKKRIVDRIVHVCSFWKNTIKKKIERDFLNK